jgi:hypothetical protein
MTDHPKQTADVVAVTHVSSDELPGTVRDVCLTVPAPQSKED